MIHPAIPLRGTLAGAPTVIRAIVHDNIICSGENADIRIHMPTVQEKHATVELRADGTVRLSAYLCLSISIVDVCTLRFPLSVPIVFRRRGS